NGKVDRKALSKIQISAADNQIYTAPREKNEEKLVAIWADLLETREKEIGIDDNFFDMGGHSLRATILISEIHKEFNVKLPMAEIFKNPSVRTLAQTIKKFKQDTYFAIQPTEKKEYYTLAPAQKRLYLLQQLELESTAYNMPHTIPIDKETGPLKLEDLFKKLIRRHESLRTSFHMVPEGGSPGTPEGLILVQKVHNTVQFKIEYYKLTTNRHSKTGELNRLSDVTETFFRPFELAKAPLLRAAVVETAGDAGERVMLVDIHHIITDGTSQGILTKEFLALSTGENLPPLTIQYRDYAQWQNSAKQKKLIENQEKYWINRFTGELPVLNLPMDNPRPAIQSFEGSQIPIIISDAQSRSIKKAAKENGATLYMTIQALFT
ncbi:MAG: non-ribosomal peptide synthetase, partial [bacterium]|nr:non-ribosomal peptide synthetase [bacterium]